MAKTLAGQTFKTDRGLRFEVVADEFWPSALEHGKPNGTYLNSLPKGTLVSVWYRAPTPVVKVKGGVVRLVEVLVDGESLTGSTNISTRLGIERTKIPVTLSRV